MMSGQGERLQGKQVFHARMLCGSKDGLLGAKCD